MAKVAALYLLGALSAAVTVLTVVWPDWIETLTGSSPDLGSGALERGTVAVLTLLAAVLVRSASQMRHRAKPSPETSLGR